MKAPVLMILGGMIMGGALTFLIQNKKPSPEDTQVAFAKLDKIEEHCRNFAEQVTTAEMAAAGRQCVTKYNKEMEAWKKVESQIPKNLKGVVTHSKPWMTGECTVMAGKSFDSASMTKLKYPEFVYFQENTKREIYKNCIDYVKVIQ